MFDFLFPIAVFLKFFFCKTFWVQWSNWNSRWNLFFRQETAADKRKLKYLLSHVKKKQWALKVLLYEWFLGWFYRFVCCYCCLDFLIHGNELILLDICWQDLNFSFRERKITLSQEQARTDKMSFNKSFVGLYLSHRTPSPQHPLKTICERIRYECVRKEHRFSDCNRPNCYCLTSIFSRSYLKRQTSYMTIDSQLITFSMLNIFIVQCFVLFRLRNREKSFNGKLLPLEVFIQAIHSL